VKVLTVNAGSSSLKLRLVGGGDELLAAATDDAGLVEPLGLFYAQRAPLPRDALLTTAIQLVAAADLALGAGVAAGIIAFAGLGVVAGDADRIFHRLTSGFGLDALVASLGAGVATLALVWRRQYELSRYTAALAVASIIAGWALAQSH